MKLLIVKIANVLKCKFCLAFFVVTLLSQGCGNTPSRTTSIKLDNFDAIEHYFYAHSDTGQYTCINIPPRLDEKPTVSVLDSLLSQILCGQLNLLEHKEMIDQLHALGFAKKVLNLATTISIDSLLINATGAYILPRKCLPVYRDILMFKKDNHPVAVVYFCFSCHSILFYSNSVDVINDINEEELTAIMFLLHGK